MEEPRTILSYRHGLRRTQTRDSSHRGAALRTRLRHISQVRLPATAVTEPSPTHPAYLARQFGTGGVHAPLIRRLQTSA